jgi:hypothetical protein
MAKKIHYYTLHYDGATAGDFFTDVPGLVTCDICKKQLQEVSTAQQDAQPTPIKHCDFCGVDTFDDEFGRCSICRNLRR